jgi:hypothetical protein
MTEKEIEISIEKIKDRFRKTTSEEKEIFNKRLKVLSDKVCDILPRFPGGLTGKEIQDELTDQYEGLLLPLALDILEDEGRIHSTAVQVADPFPYAKKRYMESY